MDSIKLLQQRPCLNPTDDQAIDKPCKSGDNQFLPEKEDRKLIIRYDLGSYSSLPYSWIIWMLTSTEQAATPTPLLTAAQQQLAAAPGNQLEFFEGRCTVISQSKARNCLRANK
ncbi:uncharacterized protein LOC115766028 [Drosophila novamexicana]|uniref:uncharacterized protein LOC115766028 n=1 Tax=Drosophila novamexicana TaxID=47314 RepID=UPI0011E59350|nr:uncharacterized protein LOC115766028 [Drosophila novamexicana]